MAKGHFVKCFAGIAGVCCPVAVAVALAQEGHVPPAQDAADADVVALQAEVERLRGIVPAQAVAMTQVAYNFGNLWFAAHAENWPLAQFYFNETRVRLRWALRITPTRKLSTGEIELAPLLERLEGAQLAALGEALAAKDVPRIEENYRAMLDGCYGCHVASEKPYLKLHVPVAPAEPMIEFAPN